MYNTDNSILNHALDLYQKCRIDGEWACLSLQTRNGFQMVNLSIQLPAGQSTGDRAGEVRKMSQKARKSPSSLRRDARRREAFLKNRRDHEESFNCESSTEKGDEPIDNSDEIIEQITPDLELDQSNCPLDDKESSSSEQTKRQDKDTIEQTDTSSDNEDERLVEHLRIFVLSLIHI